ncbi:phospholipase A and acyltransferase 4-like [Brienomyrus brachyistius]|uniref:phospholipase A and acyltransferase 4-like n=1 Tax=Brienomyrus brachyistius TaxID=42636 RepID=UPI0020B383D6|nr:phospholipase A and acyltransferase 4-like [Brienomyrus brachyistius]
MPEALPPPLVTVPPVTPDPDPTPVPPALVPEKVLDSPTAAPPSLEDDDEPKPGDLIEIFHGPYQHWAIYAGDDYVIHLTTASEAGSNSTMSVLNDKGIVKREKLLDVVGDNGYRINNLLDDKYEPRSVSTILKDDRSRVGQELPYSVIQHNCEHFVTDLRYGKPESRQVGVLVNAL